MIMATVDINTKFVTLLGSPLRQSFAALMQNAAYEEAGLNMVYFYTEVNGEHLEDVVKGLRYMNIAGFAVTKPNKVEVLKYLDELDPLCEKMGATNTVVKTADGRLVGYNTDGIGFIRSLQRDANVNIEDHTYFCIGSGGAGRAMCSALADHGAKKIYITDVFEDSSRSLVEDINNKFAPVAEFCPNGDYSKIKDASIVMNASGIGMGVHIGEDPLPKEFFFKDKLYFDACYNPTKTQFLIDAEEAGARILNGLGMSLYQGAAQIEIWTGKEAPVAAMREKLLEAIAIRDAK